LVNGPPKTISRGIDSDFTDQFRFLNLETEMETLMATRLLNLVMKIVTVVSLIFLLFSCSDGEQKKKEPEKKTGKFGAIASIQLGTFPSANEVLNVNSTNSYNDLSSDIQNLLQSRILSTKTLMRFCESNDCPTDSSAFYDQVAQNIKGIYFESVPEHQVLNIEFRTDISSDYAVEYLKVLIDELALAHFQHKMGSFNQQQNFIDEQLDQASIDLKKTEDSLLLFKTTYEAQLNPEAMQDYSISLQSDLNELEMERQQVAKIENELSKDWDLKAEEISDITPLLTGMQIEKELAGALKTLRDLLLERDELSAQPSENTERLKQVKRQINVQKNQVLKFLSNYKKELKSKKEVVKDRINKATVKPTLQPKLATDFARLERAFRIQEKHYTMLLEKKTEFAISKAGTVSDIRIIDRARPKK
jgi:uncharacterized protein involved in exopolysaccharide biosynthesis